MNVGDSVEFICANAKRHVITLLSTSAEIIRTTLQELKKEENAGRTDYRFYCRIDIDGTPHLLEREVSTQNSFYEPWEIGALRIWFDAVRDIGDFCTETHGTTFPQTKPLLPRGQTRFAIQDRALRICPDMLFPWCPLPKDGLKIEMCYRGEDCWLGAYNGASLHGGLDINHPPGTPLWAPFDLDDQFLFNSLSMGNDNNRWRGIRRWSDGTEWIIQAHHLTELTVPEHKPLIRGQQFAKGAGVLSGAVDHSHFVFKIYEGGDIYVLDPWILFWQMYQDIGANKPDAGDVI